MDLTTGWVHHSILGAVVGIVSVVVVCLPLVALLAFAFGG